MEQFFFCQRNQGLKLTLIIFEKDFQKQKNLKSFLRSDLIMLKYLQSLFIYFPKIQRFYKTCSRHAYYQYINRFDPKLLATYQTGYYHGIGRQGLFKTLVLRQAGDSIGMEEDHSYTYKMHVMAMNLMYRSGWVLFAYILIWNTFLLGDPCQVFNTSYWDLACKPSGDMDYNTRYEMLYVQDRVLRF